MTFEEYQSKARTTLVYNGNTHEELIARMALGLNGESGEIAEVVKKVLRGDGIPNYTDRLIKEMGDVLWYLACMSSILGIDFSAVAEENIKKLQDRKDRNVIKGSGDDR